MLYWTTSGEELLMCTWKSAADRAALTDIEFAAVSADAKAQTPTSARPAGEMAIWAGAPAAFALARAAFFSALVNGVEVAAGTAGT